MPETIQILLFGPARDALEGVESISICLDKFPINISNLRNRVSEQHPNLRFVLRNSMFAVGNKLCPKSQEDGQQIDGACEVVLVPPVSGG